MNKKKLGDRMNSLIVIIAVLCILYFIGIIAYTGFSSLFDAFWLGMGLGLLLLRLLFVMVEKRQPHLLMGMKMGAAVLFIAALAIYFIVVGTIIAGGIKTPAAKADYVIVLGAKVNGETASKSLHKRVMKAYDYLIDNPETKVIVSGGQGPDEDITEAECMARILLSLGIDESRIIKEERSTNTDENIKYSLEFAGKNSRVVIITCNFHIYRAMAIAKKQGAGNVTGYASSTDPLMAVHYYTREFFAVVKYKLAGQI